MPTTAPHPRFTIPQYLHIERQALDKHEYRDGEILLMPFSSARHSLITVNVAGAIRSLCRDCRAYDGSLRIHIPGDAFYTYSDALVMRDRVQLDPDDSAGETIINPLLLIEVMSPATGAYDRGEKWRRYRQLSSLQEYLLVAEDSQVIETWYRVQGDSWDCDTASPQRPSIRLRSLNIELALAEVYLNADIA